MEQAKRRVGGRIQHVCGGIIMHGSRSNKQDEESSHPGSVGPIDKNAFIGPKKERKRI